MTETFRPGDLIVRGDGKPDVVRFLVHRDGEPLRLAVGGDKAEWLAGNCRYVRTLDDLPYDSHCYDHSAIRQMSRPGHITTCSCTQMFGGSNWVKTPCCQAGRRKISSGDLVTCPSCDWYFRVFIAPAATRWISMGFGKAYRR